MKYRIVGADGKIYGPVGLEQIRLWLAQGRVESRTPVFVAGASEWTFLGLLPEFAAVSGPVAAPISGVMPVITALPAARPVRATNGYATAGLICSLLSWTCCCCFPFNLLGLVFCIIALCQISSRPVPQEGRLLAIIGLVLSGANLCFSLGMVMLQMVLNQGTTGSSWITN